MEFKTKKWQGRLRMNLATRVKGDSRRAGVAYEELQEMADDRQRWEERVVVRRRWKSEASAEEILKKCGQRCDGRVPIPPSRIIQLVDDISPS